MLEHHIESHTYIYILFVNSILTKLNKKYNLNLKKWPVLSAVRFVCCCHGKCKVAILSRITLTITPLVVNDAQLQVRAFEDWVWFT